MVEQLSLVRRRSDARRPRVGTEGRLGGQAWCPASAEPGKDLTRQRQPAGCEPHHPGSAKIAEVTTSRGARRPLRRKITVDVKVKFSN